jgi:SAM-dependent methyltransferase
MRSLSLRYTLGIWSRMGGVHPRECPCCGYRGLFRAFGLPPRFDAECKRCGSLERHRLFVLVSEKVMLLSNKLDVLHFAPEASIRNYLKKRVRTYITADISGIGVDLRENIEQSSLADASFDLIVCSHLLEHVNDVKALGELRRLLRVGGLLACMVPIAEGWDQTYENAAITRPAERDLHFGQHDHVRYYGRDFPERVASRGFDVQEHTADGEQSVRFGLSRGEKVFLAWKRG